MSFAWQKVLQPNGFWPPSLQFAVLYGDGWLVGAAPNMEFARADYVGRRARDSTNDLFSDSVDAARARERGLLLRY